ncbi:hypothetical protein RchiOBHm_Chr3g0452021 [Rosa chinensis]|uniref:Uncharacterized protein n=2 Tax=Rosa chinensis TaxID=74649 RepID=A0A2P6R672_ROSCH|nr:hypothetical protein RchiOBHm_Chr3g0452021 [Rosa chinensis]
MLQDVWPDMQLLENQLPFFILDDLFEPQKVRISSKSDSSVRLSITNLSEKFVKSQMHIEGVDDCLKRISKADHFVDFIRTLCLPWEFSHEVGGELKTVTTLSMRELDRAGVKFKVGSSKNLFDIRFTDGVLEVPKLTLSDETWIRIRNLLAFEQCQCIENYVYDYVFIMKCFVRTRKDVELLMQHGIVENRLGDSRGVYSDQQPCRWCYREP